MFLKRFYRRAIKPSFLYKAEVWGEIWTDLRIKRHLTSQRPLLLRISRTYRTICILLTECVTLNLERSLGSGCGWRMGDCPGLLIGPDPTRRQFRLSFPSPRRQTNMIRNSQHIKRLSRWQESRPRRSSSWLDVGNVHFTHRFCWVSVCSNTSLDRRCYSTGFWCLVTSKYTRPTCVVSQRHKGERYVKPYGERWMCAEGN